MEKCDTIKAESAPEAGSVQHEKYLMVRPGSRLLILGTVLALVIFAGIAAYSSYYHKRETQQLHCNSAMNILTRSTIKRRIPSGMHTAHCEETYTSVVRSYFSAHNGTRMDACFRAALLPEASSCQPHSGCYGLHGATRWRNAVEKKRMSYVIHGGSGTAGAPASSMMRGGISSPCTSSRPLRCYVEKEYELRPQQVQLALRQIQVCFNPYFLYNTLELIRGKLYEHGNVQSTSYPEKLSRIFRNLASSKSFASIQKEISFCTLYALLLELRYKIAVSISYDIASELPACCPT